MSTAALKSAETAWSYTGPIFDADTHLFETADAFTKFLPEELKDKYTIAFKTGADGNHALHVGDTKVEITADHYSDGKVPKPGSLHEWLRAIKEGRHEVDFRVDMDPTMTDPEARLKLMDEWGVTHTILFIGHMLAALTHLDDVKVAYKVINAYNEWLEDHWSFNYKGRIFAAPIVTLADLELGIEQVKWAAAKGARLILMPMGPFNGKAPAHPDHDAFWKIVNDNGMRVVLHVGEAIYMKDHMAVWGEKMQQSRMKQSALNWMLAYGERPVMETLASFIFYNFFERFPNVKILSAENGAEWVPSMLVKMDKVRGMAKNGYWPCGQLPKRPSQIFMENVMVVAYPEDDIKAIIAQTGRYDWLLMGSDYPHSEGVPHARDFAEEACAEMPEEQVRAVMYENGLRFMGLEG